jgi:hypothetical protein
MGVRVNEPCGTTCTPSVSGKVSIAATSVVGGGNLQWKFWARKKGTSAWTLLHDWHASPTFADWTPGAGTYDVMVYAREVGFTTGAYSLSKTGVYAAP